MFQTVSAFVALDNFTIRFPVVFPVSDDTSGFCTSNRIYGAFDFHAPYTAIYAPRLLELLINTIVGQFTNFLEEFVGFYKI